jgi:colanic acid/amylovoran biosynthesis glycosyltransferase
MNAPTPNGSVAYVLKKFPVLSETFVLNEILAVEEQGLPVHIFSLERPNDPRYHPGVGRLRAPISYLPDALQWRTLVRYNQRAARQYGRPYARAVGRALASGHPTQVWRALQAGYIASEVRRLKVTHLHAHFANRPTTVTRYAAAIASVPYSFTAHAVDIFKDTVREDILARKIADARFVVTVSDYNKSLLERVAKDSSAPIRRIYNGIDLTRFSPNGQPADDPFTVICVARLVEKKGVDVLIEACALLRDRGLRFRCVVVGKGRLRTTLSALIDQRGLSGHVTLLGAQAQHEVIAHYHASHVYVLPCIVGPDGNRDGLPVSIVEALASGLPVVTTPMTGIPEVVRDGENGRLVPPGDAGALAEALEGLIRRRDYYEGLRARARESVTGLFDIRDTAARLCREFTGHPS